MLLGEGGPHERGGKRGALPLKRRYSITIGSSNVKIIADRHKHAAYHNKCTKHQFIHLLMATCNE